MIEYFIIKYSYNKNIIEVEKYVLFQLDIHRFIHHRSYKG